MRLFIGVSQLIQRSADTCELSADSFKLINQRAKIVGCIAYVILSFLYIAQNLLGTVVGMTHQPLHGIDAGVDFAGGLTHFLRQNTHLIGNNCKATASFTGACRLN